MTVRAGVTAYVYIQCKIIRSTSSLTFQKTMVFFLFFLYSVSLLSISVVTVRADVCDG